MGTNIFIFCLNRCFCASQPCLLQQTSTQRQCCSGFPASPPLALPLSGCLWEEAGLRCMEDLYVQGVYKDWLRQCPIPSLLQNKGIAVSASKCPTRQLHKLSQLLIKLLDQVKRDTSLSQYLTFLTYAILHLACFLLQLVRGKLTVCKSDCRGLYRRGKTMVGREMG